MPFSGRPKLRDRRAHAVSASKLFQLGDRLVVASDQNLFARFQSKYKFGKLRFGFADIENYGHGTNPQPA
jgi:hypothetical protein